MAQEPLASDALSAFCGSIATMISAGIQTDEAVRMLAESRRRSRFQDVCNSIYEDVSDGAKLADAMERSGGFPAYAVEMVRTGERSGHLEEVLSSLESYYDEEARLFNKLSQTVSYPAALLVIMTAILAFCVFVIIPIFTGVYASMLTSLSGGSLASIRASQAIGAVTLVFVGICAVIAVWLALSSRTEGGRRRVMAILEHLPITRKAAYQLALSRFTATLSSYLSSGMTAEDAMVLAMEATEHRVLRERVRRAHESMVAVDDPRSLTQAVGEQEIFEPIYARMLNVGILSGSTDSVLHDFSDAFFDDAIEQLDRVLDLVEPLFAAFLTISVGVTLVAILLPLLGIMRAIG